MDPGRGDRRREGIRWTLALAAVVGTLGAVGLAALGRADLPPSLAEGTIPAVAYDAYRAASAAAPGVAAGCAVDWTVIAGIGQVESRHGRTQGRHELAPNGDVRPPIRGAALDGSGGTRALPDSDDGLLDGDTTWDRAIGPLQFIPTTWQELGLDGNGDGRADPDNLYDAALTTVAHLCVRSPGDYSDPRALREALLTYNASRRYADEVEGWIELYRTEPLVDVVESAAPEPRG